MSSGPQRATKTSDDTTTSEALRRAERQIAEGAVDLDDEGFGLTGRAISMNSAHPLVTSCLVAEELAQACRGCSAA